MLCKGGVNVCRSEVFRDIDVKGLATRRLRRVEAAKEATAAQTKQADAANGVAETAPGPAPMDAEAVPEAATRGKC